MSQNDRPTFTGDDVASAKEAVKAAEEITGAPKSSVEELSRKAEKLIGAANKLLEQIEVETADPSKLQIDREVRQALDQFNEVYVSNQQPEYAYAWIYRDPYNTMGGRYVRQMQALGWEVVQGENPEAKEHRHVDGTRVVSDCLLMRVRLDRKMLLDRRDALLREAQQAGIVSRIQDLAERAGTRVYDKLPGFVEEAMADQSRARQQQALKTFHRMNAGGKVDRMIRTGAIPGVPAPGAGR
jgi:hypothetical protein